METRKVQQVGGGTYTVSIPVHWANEHDVGAGDTAYLYTHRDGSLVVRWDEKENSRLAVTDVELVDSTPRFAEHALDAAYTAGYARIVLRASDGLGAEQRRAITDRTRTLSGVDVTEETDRHVAVRGLLDAGDVSIRQSVLQLRFTALAAHDAAMDALADGSTGIEHVVERDREADRTARLVARHFNRALVDMDEVDQLGLSRRRLFEYHTATRHVRRIATNAVEIARIARRADASLAGDVAAELQAVDDVVRNIVEDATDALVDADARSVAHAVRKQRAAVRRDTDRLERALADHDASTTHLVVRVLDRLRRTADRGAAVADLALQSSLRA